LITQFAIRCFKDNNRVSPSQLDDVEARLFYKELEEFFQAYKTIYGDTLTETSLLIRIDEREIYRTHARLLEHNILTVDDIIHYLNVENVLYVIKNNDLITDLSEKIIDTYVLELYTKESLLTPKQLNKIREETYE